MGGIRHLVDRSFQVTEFPHTAKCAFQLALAYRKSYMIPSTPPSSPPGLWTATGIIGVAGRILALAGKNFALPFPYFITLNGLNFKENIFSNYF